MLTQYRFHLTPNCACRARPEWGYRLYAALLERSDAAFGENVHRDGVTPVSQFLRVGQDGELLWTVNLLGNEAETALCGVLEQAGQITLEKDGVTLSAQLAQRRAVADADELLALAAAHSGEHRLAFRTATAFKRQGRYLNLPTARLIVQSLVKKWNGCITDCLIEDEDGEGLDALANGLRVKSFHLSDRMYYLKGNSIPGFTGELLLDNRLSGFQRQLTDALLLFADFAGVGIKTTLGMGGVEHK